LEHFAPLVKMKGMAKLKQTDFDGQRLKIIGLLLNRARQNLRYSYRELGKIADVSPSQILRMESGEFDYSLTKFLRIAEALGLSVGIILEAAMYRMIPRPEFSEFNNDEIEAFVKKLLGLDEIGPDNIESLEDSAFFIRQLIRSLAEVVSALVLSSHIDGMCFYFNPAFAPLRDKIEGFAHLYSGSWNTHLERVALLKSLMQNPFLKLRSLGILDDKILGDYLLWCKKNPDLTPELISCSWAASHISMPVTTQESGENLQGESKSSKEGLDKSAAMPHDADASMKINSLPKLIGKLKKLTKVRGQKAALAKKFNVSRQAVDQWLSGDAKPSAETTFALLNWAEEREGQK
jgi:transcriptional regulator with XRE-family HTH domain